LVGGGDEPTTRGGEMALLLFRCERLVGFRFGVRVGVRGGGRGRGRGRVGNRLGLGMGLGI